MVKDKSSVKVIYTRVISRLIGDVLIGNIAEEDWSRRNYSTLVWITICVNKYGCFCGTDISVGDLFYCEPFNPWPLYLLALISRDRPARVRLFLDSRAQAHASPFKSIIISNEDQNPLLTGHWRLNSLFHFGSVQCSMPGKSEWILDYHVCKQTTGRSAV